MKDLPQGKYRVFALVSNLVRTDIVSVEVKEGETASVELKILPLVASVKGQVVSPKGEPIPNAELSFTMAGGWNAEFKAYTDQNGKFEVRNLPPGLYYVAAKAEGRAEVFAGKFNFEPEKSYDGIKVVLPRAATIAGKVVAPKEKLLSTYALVQTFEPNSDRHLPAVGGGTSALTRVMGDGSYRLTDLAPGNYTLFLIVDGEVVDKVKVTVKEGETVNAPPLKVK